MGDEFREPKTLKIEPRQAVDQALEESIFGRIIQPQNKERAGGL